VLAVLALAIALVMLTVKQYTRLLFSTVDLSSVQSVDLLLAVGDSCTSSTVEVRAAGLLPVAVGVRWDSLLLVVTYCRDSSRRCSNVC
jgi:hypothetical protein